MPSASDLRMRAPRNLLIAAAFFCSIATSLGADPTVVVNPPRPRTNVTINVGDYLVTPGGTPQNAFRAFRAALDAAHKTNAARVVVPPGRYVFDDPGVVKDHAHLSIYRQRDLEIDGRGAQLVFT